MRPSIPMTTSMSGTSRPFTETRMSVFVVSGIELMDRHRHRLQLGFEGVQLFVRHCFQLLEVMGYVDGLDRLAVSVMPKHRFDCGSQGASFESCLEVGEICWCFEKLLGGGLGGEVR